MIYTLDAIEKELKNRWKYQYVWRRKQNNIWDSYTNYIYTTLSWEALIPKIAATAATHQLNKHDIFYYAINRWYNFWSAQAVEHIFTQSPQVRAVQNKRDKNKDFYFQSVPFDHKTSVFPKGFEASFLYAQQHKRELIHWLYEHQSSQQRHHLKNRLFVIAYHSKGEHWKLKAQIGLLHKTIEKYMQDFTLEQLERFTFVPQTETLSDIIWVTA